MNPNEKYDDGNWNMLVVLVVLIIAGIIVSALKVFGVF